MQVDTDVLIWYFRGLEKARDVMNKLDSFSISAIVYMELLQGVRNKTEMKKLKHFINERDVNIIPINEIITLKAMFLIENYALGHGLRLADALIAATADVKGETLLTANVNHYRIIPTLTLKQFTP